MAAKAVAWNAILSIVAIVVGTVVSIAQVRLLTKADFAPFTAASQILRYFQIFSLFTLDAALLRYIPEYRARGDRRGIKQLILLALGLNFAAWLLVVVVTAATAGLITHVNRMPMQALMYTGAAMVLPSVVQVSLQAVLTAFYRIRVQVIGTVAGGFAQLFCLWLFIQKLKLGGAGAMMAQIGMSGLLLIVFLYQLRKLPLPPQSGEYQPFPVRRLIGFSLPYVINLLAASVFRFQSEVLFLLPYHGRAMTSTYSYAYMVSQRFLEFVPAAFYGVGNVMVSTAFLEGREQLKRVVSIYWRIIAVSTAAVSVGGFVLADKLTLFLFGAKAQEAGHYAAILFLTQACVTFINPYNFVMRAEEKTWLAFWLSPPAAIISLGIDYLLIPRYGLHGAVIATSLSYSAVSLVQYIAFQRVFPYLKMPFGYIARCYVACLPMLLAIPLKGAVPGHSGLLVGFAAAAVLWAVGVRALRLLGEDEISLITRSNLPGMGVLVRVLAR